MRWMTGIALAIGLVGLSTVAQAQGLKSQPHLIVSGQGEVQVTPDKALVTLGVDVQAHTAKEASRTASRQMTDVLAVLTRSGIAAEDIQTSGLSLNPIYERRQDAARAPRLVAFQAKNTLRVTVRDLDRLGILLDDVIEDGANTFRSVSFGLEDRTAAEEAARRLAVADALRKAEVLTDAAGVEAGPILSITEGGGARPQPEFAMRSMAMADAAVPVAPGSLSIGATVTLVFGLDQ